MTGDNSERALHHTARRAKTNDSSVGPKRFLEGSTSSAQQGVSRF